MYISVKRNKKVMNTNESNSVKENWSWQLISQMILRCLYFLVVSLDLFNEGVSIFQENMGSNIQK